MKRDIVIIGAGPGGLKCAEILAKKGLSVLVLEKNRTIGRKVCAGGITWSGMIGRIPEKLIEKSFCNQFVTTRNQNIRINSKHPIIATVDRKALGWHMADTAKNAGADIITGAGVRNLDNNSIYYTKDQKLCSVSCDFLVGADGSLSKVRSFLGLQSYHMGTGINYQVPITRDEMIWYFDARSFGSGYSWIFPHRKSVSVGVYAGCNRIPPTRLKNNLIKWLKLQNISVETLRPQAEKINFDFRGWRFGRTFLVGDAAGLASPLTGEGIFPAILSAETVAETIVDKHFVPVNLKKLLKKHRKHYIMLKMAGSSPIIATLLSEVSAFMLRHKLISFKKFEMG